MKTKQMQLDAIVAQAQSKKICVNLRKSAVKLFKVTPSAKTLPSG
jgi:hypothetical protein